MANTQKRARKGGEVAVNGEFYKGGAFIATTDRPKSQTKKRGSGKQEYAPYKWAVPEEGTIAIFHFLQKYSAHINWQSVRNGKAELMVFSEGSYYSNLESGKDHLVLFLVNKYIKEEYWIEEDHIVIQGLS